MNILEENSIRILLVKFRGAPSINLLVAGEGIILSEPCNALKKTIKLQLKRAFILKSSSQENMRIHANNKMCFAQLHFIVPDNNYLFIHIFKHKKHS